MSQSIEEYKIIHNISMPVSAGFSEACAHALRKLGLPLNTKCYVYRQSIDARRKNNIQKVFSIAIQTDIENQLLIPLIKYKFNPEHINLSQRPYIIGAGPSGLFCALTLARYGLKPIVIERGKDIDRRSKDVERIWDGCEINCDSNVQFGEGGAGTFSDGKLVTRINDPRCRQVLEDFCHFGAHDDILYMAKPHIGTDVLRSVVKNMRKKICDLGGEFYFDTKLTDIEIKNGKLSSIFLNDKQVDCNLAVVAIGNGAKDTYNMLMNRGIYTEAKPFSVGFRMEHLQKDIDQIMYGSYSDSLSGADYLFSSRYTDFECAYTFCMCPGGYVINAASDKNTVVTNGMSFYSRTGINANSAMLAAVKFETVKQGLDFQTMLEQRAYILGKSLAPCILQKDFLNGTVSTKFGRILPTFKPGTHFCDFSDLYPSHILSVLKKGVVDFSRKIIDCDDAVFTGPETRTSAPLRFTRDPETRQVKGFVGIYPCGEGSGYAGGITSSAVDGIKTAEAIISRM